MDDFLHCGTSEFKKLVIEPLIMRFQAGKCQKRNFVYCGLEINQRDECVIVSQSEYTDNLSLIDASSGEKSDELSREEYTLFRAAVGKLNWLAVGTRPDVAFDVIEHSTKFNKATKADLYAVNNSISRVKKTSVSNVVPNLGNVKQWRIVGFADAAHANICDGVGSTGAYIICLVGQEMKSTPIHWRSNKIPRVVRSTLASEALAMAEMVDMALYIQAILETVSGVVIPCLYITDSRSLFDAVYSTKLVDDKRLRIDIAYIKQCSVRKQIAFKWCEGKRNLANSLTKRGACTKGLTRHISSGMFPSDGLPI